MLDLVENAIPQRSFMVPPGRGLLQIHVMPEPRFCKIYAQGGDDEEIVWATLNFDALEYARSISTLKRGEWQLIAGEYQELLQEQTQ